MAVLWTQSVTVSGRLKHPGETLCVSGNPPHVFVHVCVTNIRREPVCVCVCVTALLVIHAPPAHLVYTMNTLELCFYSAVKSANTK